MAIPGSELAEAAKNAGVALTAASAAAYACGYLVIRTRAHALGTDPGFSLIDQAYVFAGVRFVLITLFALLLTAPVLLLFRTLGRLLAGLDPGWLLGIEWIVAASFGAITIAAFSVTLGVENVLLATDAPHAQASFAGQLRASAFGRNDSATVLIIGTTALAALMLLWARAHYARHGGPDALAALLLLIGALLLVLLPMQQGTFLADRKARRLDRVPDGVTGILPPVWLIDRGTAERAVLLARDAAGAVRLVTIKAEKLDGVGVTAVDTLAEALAMGEKR